MAFQWFSVSMILIVLSLVQINAARYRSIRQTTTEACANPTFEFCNFVVCENGGECVLNSTSAECYQCNCAVGFTGRLCESPIVTPIGCNPPCLNGGTCQQTVSNAYICTCSSEFTGSQCETAVVSTHICLTNPTSVCQNGGTCTLNGAGYLCSCATGFTGTNCESQATGNCPAGFCLSGGICTMNGSMPMCQCPPTHTGTRCETVIGTQITTTATLTTVTATATLTTVTTTAGSTIRPIPGKCSPTSCSNGGTCYNTGNDFICLCTPQWSGQTCTVQSPPTTPRPTTPAGFNPCSPNPCNNGGTCYKHGSSYVCLCKSQYSGPTCTSAATTVTPPVTSPGTIKCESKPCQNGADCYNTGTSYFCFCGTNSKFTGKNCETAITTVPSDCPLDCGSGSCVRSGGQQVVFACMCNGTISPTKCVTK